MPLFFLARLHSQFIYESVFGLRRHRAPQRAATLSRQNMAHLYTVARVGITRYTRRYHPISHGITASSVYPPFGGRPSSVRAAPGGRICRGARWHLSGKGGLGLSPTSPSSVASTRTPFFQNGRGKRRGFTTYPCYFYGKRLPRTTVLFRSCARWRRIYRFAIPIFCRGGWKTHNNSSKTNETSYQPKVKYPTHEQIR